LHILCQVCVHDILEKNQQKGLPGECPECRKEFTETQILQIIKNDFVGNSNEDDSLTRKPSFNLKSVNFKPSSKLALLMENISFMYSQDDESKCVCFSQWTSMLDIIETELNMHDLCFVRLDGTMSQSKRDQSIQKFKNDPKVRILVASLRATGMFLFFLFFFSFFIFLFIYLFFFFFSFLFSFFSFFLFLFFYLFISFFSFFLFFFSFFSFFLFFLFFSKIYNNSRFARVKYFLIKGVGLNLTEASYVFLMDPWWNESVENQ